MKQTQNLIPGGYYMFESLGCSKSVYFNSSEEIRIFKILLNRYLGKFIKIHRLYVDANGYNVLLRLNQKRSLINTYKSGCEKKSRDPKALFLKEPWRIISERIRIFHSTYAKTINSIRGREGVLVKNRYLKFHFENEHELANYISGMDCGKKIESQKNSNFECLREGTDILNWLSYRASSWIESTMNIAFQSYVVRKLIYYTALHHNPYHNPHPY